MADLRAQMVADLRQLVELDSPTADHAACGAVLDVLAPKFAALGGTVVRHAAANGSPVLVTRWGDGDSGPLVLGHVDTVFGPGESTRRPFTVSGGLARGPGVFDMKGGLVQLLFALRELRRREVALRLTVLLNADEEIGSPHSEAFIRAEAQRASCALVLEPAGPGGAVKSARKGIAMYRIEVDGVAAHPGLDPDKGVNAITELAEHVLAVERLASVDAGTTVNIGTITGGTSRNVVAAAAAAEFEARFWTTAEAKRVDEMVGALRPRRAGAAVRVTGGIHRQPMERTADAARLVELARASARRDGWDLADVWVGGVSDGNITAAMGVPTLDGLGVEGSGAHSVDEFVNVDTMARRVRLLEHFLVAVMCDPALTSPANFRSITGDDPARAQHARSQSGLGGTAADRQDGWS
jgi:glutamate carboxypeptidase